MRKISFYYQPLNQPISSVDRLSDLIEMHIRSFEYYGWEVVRLDESIAAKHKDYEKFNNPDSILAKSKNPWEYTRACYMRWLAYAVAGHPFADFDVVNYGFTPQNAMNIRDKKNDDFPIFISGAGAMGLIEGEEWSHVINTYIDFIDCPVIEGPIKEDINDMTIMRHMHAEWYNAIPYSDVNFVRDYSYEGWGGVNLVHYPHGLTPLPRVDTIIKNRPPSYLNI